MTEEQRKVVRGLATSAKGAIFAIDSAIMLSDLNDAAKQELRNYRNHLETAMEHAIDTCSL